MKTTAILLILSILITGCNLPSRDQVELTATSDIVATEVSRLQTVIPTSTIAPTQPPTNTPQPTTPTPSVTSTSVPASTSTAIPGDPAAALGAPSWQDNLETTKNFYLYENENTAVEAGEGSLRLVGKTANGWLGWSLTYAQNASNFYLEGIFKTGTCSGGDVYGLVFRASKENAGYFYGITCDGRYNLYARDFNNNTNTEILPLKSNAAILTGSGQTNRIGVKAEGNKIALYANGVLLEELSNDIYSSGYFGPFIAANDTANFTVDLDQIALWKLK